MRGEKPERTAQDGEERRADDQDWLFHALPDMLCTAGFDGYLKRANPVWTKVLGWTAEEMTSVPWLHFVHPDDLEVTIETGEKLLAGGHVLAFENRYRCKDGSYRWLSWDAVPLPDRQEIVAVARDVTAQREAKEQMAQLTQRLNLAKGAGEIGIWDYDLQRQKLVCDDLLHSLIGIEQGKLGGDWQAWHRFLHPADAEQVVAAVRSALWCNKESFEMEFRIVRLDGSVRHVRCVGAVHGGGDGNPARVLGVCWDVTKSTWLHEILRRREAWAKGLQEAGEKMARCQTLESLAETAAKAPVEYLGLRFSAISEVEKDGRVRLLARCPDELTQCGRVSPCLREVATSARNIVVRDTWNAAPFGAPCMEWAKQGGFASCATYPIFAGERCVAVLSLRDGERDEASTLVQARPLLEVFCRQVGQVWDRCLREEQLREARHAAEAACQAKSNFLANMSHEIRTPMNAILGFTRLLQSDRHLSPQQRKHLDAVTGSCEHLSTLINDVLEMSRIEAGRSPVQACAMDLRNLVRDLEVSFREQAAQKGIEMVATVGEGVPDWVLGDESKLRNVLGRLMGNAFKFTPRGRVDLRVLVDRADGEGVRLTFEVEDTGVGIPEGDRRRIFDAFEQGAEGLRHEGSTGLGLAISQNYVRIMGGEIEVESELGRGSRFRFSLNTRADRDGFIGKSQTPTTPERHGWRARLSSIPSSRSGSSGPVVSGLAKSHQGARVLVVDDHPSNRNLLVSILRPLGFHVCEASTGLEAVSMVEAFCPVLVLMDTRMPEMDGIEATRRIKASEKGSRVVVIGLSGSVSDDDQRGLSEAGGSAFLCKPFNTAELLEAIHKHTGIEFEYEDRDQACRGIPSGSRHPSLSFRMLSQELLQRLRKVTVACDTDGIVELCSEIAVQDHKTAALVRELATDLRLDILRAALNG